MSSIIIEKKYMGFITSRLRNVKFKNKSNVLMSFSHTCERTDSRKSRASFLLYKGKMFVHCFHCGLSCSFPTFLKEIDPTLYNEFCIEMFKEGIWQSKNPEPFELPKPQLVNVNQQNDFDGLVSYTTLANNHPAIQYCIKRGLNDTQWKDFWFVPKFFSWASRFDDSFKRMKSDHPRMIIPFRHSGGKLIGFSARAFGRESPKYIKIKRDENAEFLYGLDRLQLGKKIIVVEGQIDSLFIDNAIAVGSANYNYEFLNSNKDEIIIVPDNDFRRNKAVCQQVRKAIDQGFSVCFLPESWKKDINDEVISGRNPSEINEYILSNHQKNAAAILSLTLERRC